jgi:isoquinoline 1-oxidoreductase beta subunit
MKDFWPDRRKFLKLGAAVAGSSLVLGINWSCTADSPPSADADVDTDADAFVPNAWLRIDREGKVTVIVAESEMGQGPFTLMPMMLAEELEVPWDLIQVERAPLKPVYGRQVTGGSSSIRKGWATLREAGAVARELLLQAAAARWQVPVRSCRAELAQVFHVESRRQATYAELAPLAAELPIPQTARLKEPGEFRIIGTAAPRTDTPDKINGRARYGIDTKLPDMRYATITHCPVFGGHPKSVNSEAALNIKGVLDVFTIDEGVVVLATDTWSAFKGKAALDITWHAGEKAELSDASIKAMLSERQIGDSTLITQQGNPQELLGAEALAQDYTLPFQAHVPLEPMNCTATYENDKLRIWAPTQSPSEAYHSAHTATQSKLSRAMTKVQGKLFESEDDSIEINTTLLGGGFGRRLKQDFVSEAAQIAQHIQGPVQLVWTREEDVQHDFYHPLILHQMRGRLDDTGKPVAWHHIIRGPNAKPSGATELPYAIPHQRVDLVNIGKQVLPVGPWRSVQHHYNAYAVEHFFDLLARAGGQDPVQLRLQMMGSSPRLRKTLEVAAETAGWDYSTGLFGAASAAGFGSYVSEVVELEPNGDHLQIAKITCVLDCGIVINPDIARQQMEGSIIFGLTAALKSSISIKQGRVQQSNYHDYPLLTLAETPPIEVVLIDSQESPEGIGEPGVPPLAPALANAVMAASGKPVPSLPLNFDRRGIAIG